MCSTFHIICHNWFVHTTSPPKIFLTMVKSKPFINTFYFHNFINLQPFVERISIVHMALMNGKNPFPSNNHPSISHKLNYIYNYEKLIYWKCCCHAILWWIIQIHLIMIFKNILNHFDVSYELWIVPSNGKRMAWKGAIFARWSSIVP
jgi:hypothetical protein